MDSQNGESSNSNSDDQSRRDTLADLVKEKTTDTLDYIIIEDKQMDIDKNVENNLFRNHILSTKSSDSNPPELPCSFATLSENYEKSKCDTNSSKENAPSILSKITENYQDSSSDDSTSSEVSKEEIFIDSDNESKTEFSSGGVKSEYALKTKGELDICDLPPIEDLKISVEESQCEPVGCIKSIVGTLVVIETFINQPALDIDSVLFVDRGQRALGKIFDVFGSVLKPYYSVRFNDSDHIKSFNVKIKEPVYCAPKTEYSSYVLVSQLLKMKGSDASWKDNNEPPQEYLDYSDDEVEQLAKKNRKPKKYRNAKKNGAKSQTPEALTTQDACQDDNVAEITVHSTVRNSEPEQMYAPHPAYNHQSMNYGHGRFPTYAQHLSAMNHSQMYHQPYNPWYYAPMYPPQQFPFHQQPRNNYPQPPQNQPRYNYSQPPQQQPRYNYSQPPQQQPMYNYPQPPQQPPPQPPFYYNNPNGGNFM